MDGPAEVNQVRAPKRPYPEEDEEKPEVRALASLSHTIILTFQPIVLEGKKSSKIKKVKKVFHGRLQRKGVSEFPSPMCSIFSRI